FRSKTTLESKISSVFSNPKFASVGAATSRKLRIRGARANEQKGNEKALPDVRFQLVAGRPNPAFDAQWQEALRGSRVDVVLRSDHVLFRPVEFPTKAMDFLDGMVRSQVDRLTPWTANEAAFGWSPPATVANERIELMLAATSKAKIDPLV